MIARVGSDNYDCAALTAACEQIDGRVDVMGNRSIVAQKMVHQLMSKTQFKVEATR